MPYFLYHQNNSGGVYLPPAANVIVKAGTPEEADDIAIEHGVYFDWERDCSCCGSRWGEASEWDAYDSVDDIPAYYVTGDPDSQAWAKEDRVAYSIVVEDHTSW